MSYKSKFITLLIVCLILFVFAFDALAVDYLPLVPCGLNQPPEGGDADWNYTRSCTTCDSFRLAKNVIDFVLFGLVPPIAVLLFIIGGFLILLGGGKPDLVIKGKTIFWSTFIGLIIVFSSWLIVNTILKSFAPDQIAGAWYKLTCEEAVRKPLEGIRFGERCDNPQILAQQNNAVFPEKNAPELNQLIACIRSKLPGEDLGSKFTFDEENRLCNFTRGKETCGRCAHTANSCHYGGAGGNTGSLAVDFGNEDIGDKIIKAALECGGKDPRCEDQNGNRVACPNPAATHVHINSPSCDRN